MRRLFPVLLLLGCTRPPAATAPDAGTPVDRGTDLRNAITTVFPEYRGALIMAARSQLTRLAAPATQQDLEQARAAAVANGFTGDPPTRKPLVLDQQLDAGVLVQELRMGFSPDELGRIMAAPSSMTTEAMGHWLPKTTAAKQREEFELELVWVAKDVARADFLVWQLVDGALTSGWTAELPQGWHRERTDAGVVVPAQFLLEVKNPGLGARIEVERKADRARLRYVLSTFERR